MSEKKFTVKNGDEIIVRVSKGKRAAGAAAKSAPRTRKGIIKTRRPPDALPRRLNAEVLVNFYDLGRIKNGNGDFIDLPYLALTGYRFNENNSFAGYDDFTTANWNALRDLLFVNDPATWAEKHPKLTYQTAERYGVDLMAKGKQLSAARSGARQKIDSPDPVTSDKWTADGLKVPSGADLKLLTYSAFYRFDTADAANIKITNLPDYAAEAVEFSLSKATDVYLVPLVAAQFGDVTNSQGQPQKTLLAQHSIMSRALFLDNADFQAATAKLSVFVMPVVFTGVSSTAFLETVLAFFKARPETVAYNQVTGEFIPLEDFPSNAAYSLLFDNISPAFNNVEPALPRAGTLLAVLKQNDNWFYVWAKAQQLNTPVLFSIGGSV